MCVYRLSNTQPYRLDLLQNLATLTDPVNVRKYFVILSSTNTGCRTTRTRYLFNERLLNSMNSRSAKVRNNKTNAIDAIKCHLKLRKKYFRLNFFCIYLPLAFLAVVWESFYMDTSTVAPLEMQQNHYTFVAP